MRKVTGIKARYLGKTSVFDFVHNKIYDVWVGHDGQKCIIDWSGDEFYGFENNPDFEVLTEEQVSELKKLPEYQSHKCPVCGKGIFSMHESHETCEVCGWWDSKNKEFTHGIDSDEYHDLWKRGKVGGDLHWKYLFEKLYLVTYKSLLEENKHYALDGVLYLFCKIGMFFTKKGTFMYNEYYKMFQMSQSVFRTREVNDDLLLGLENRIVYTIVDVVEERCKLKQALVKDKKNPNLCLLAAAQTRDKSAVTEEQLKEICEKLQEDFDFILVDCPAGIEQGFQNAVAGASEAIVVTTPEMSAVRDADRIIGLLEAKEEIKSYKLLINRVRPNLIKSNDMMSVEDVVEILSADLIGIIPEDTGIITSTNKGEPIVNDDKSLAGQAYNNVARRIIGEDVPFLNLEEPQGVVAKVKKFFTGLMGGKK